MTYVMSDLHGRYDRYIAMLDKIKFSENDTLYVLGDCIDGVDGSEPVKLLKDMMRRKNVINLQGNHEFWALPLLRPLMKISFEDYGVIGYRNYRFGKVDCDLGSWLSFGGDVTFEQFVSLPKSEIAELLDYMSGWGFYMDITVNGKRYIMSHSGVHDYHSSVLAKLHKVSPREWTFNRRGIYYHCRYFSEHDNVYLVTGHIASERIDPNFRGKIFRSENHIVVDTGTTYGRSTGCLCLETNEEFYVS